MKLKPINVIINTSLVIFSLFLAFILIQFTGRFLLKKKLLFYKSSNRPSVSQEVRNFYDLKKATTLNGRVGELARVIDSLGLDKKIKPGKPSEKDMGLFNEVPGTPVSLSGRKIIRQKNGLVPDLNDTFIIRGRFTGKEKVRAHYRTDSQGRRLTGTENKINRKKNIIFLGCSFTFGFGVNDEDTFPYKVREKIGLNVYNYGITGSSPAVTLKILKEMKAEYFRLISREETTVIYTMIPDHLNRIIGTVSNFRHIPDSFHTQPFISSEDGELIIRDSFSDDPTYRKHFLNFLSRIHLLKVFDVDFPTLKKEHFLLTARILQEIEKELKDNYPQVKSFHVALYPSGGSQQNYSTLRDTLFEAKLNVLDYSMINSNALLWPQNTIKYDFHPSPLAYTLYSELLVHDLRKIIKK